MRKRTDVLQDRRVPVLDLAVVCFRLLRLRSTVADKIRHAQISRNGRLLFREQYVIWKSIPCGKHPLTGQWLSEQAQPRRPIHVRCNQPVTVALLPSQSTNEQIERPTKSLAIYTIFRYAKAVGTG